MKNKLLLIIFLASLSTSAYNQAKNRYFVYFTDKTGENYSYTIDSPEAFLTQRAIDRREKQGIDIDNTDLPVHPEYVDGLRATGVEVFFTSRWINGSLINAQENQISSVSALEFVDSIALIANGTRLTFETNIPDDPIEFLEPASVGGDSDIQLAMLGADDMHSDNIKGQGMRIAVLDNGYRGVNQYTPFQHLWENDRIIATKDFVSNSGNVFQYGDHGTSVFSIISSNFVSATGNLYGTAYEAEFILCITEDNEDENRVEEYNWLLGAEYADSLGADVINGSLGYRVFDIDEHNYTFEDMDGKSNVVAYAATKAAEKGIIVVVSAGNEGNKSWKRITPPADAIGILTVGSVDPDFSYSGFSSVGPTADGRIKPDVAAFGSNTAVVRGSGNIVRGSGTSFASPLIAGFAAGIWQANPDWTSEEVIQAIKNSGHRNHSPDTLRGWGVPNYWYAVNGETALNVEDILEDKVTVYPNPFNGDTLYLITEGKFKKGMNIKVIDPKGSMVYNKAFKKKDIKENMELNIDGSQQGVYFLFLQIGNNQKIVKLINF
ncbi:Por secretion system C-terminal sorting domain-containing protein [Ekhidna lutea]|uniref:Por secretion system C-terminal sorting domain-containing protein n=1 Tax=Ekhidna lutea TaxID=447679 RepID=A0A239GZW3_EKHLU|nr:S8 family serine peptidase [Ekhidna lutea]SNS74093.1 Por secretion system C-terminal sorting domain-containing protein [Ekhidna lutea]